MVRNLTSAQAEVGSLFADALAGDRAAAVAITTGIGLSEGLSTSDLPPLLSPTLSAISLANYQETPQVWKDFAGREDLPDFEKQEYRSFTPDWSDADVEPSTGGDTFISGGLPTVPEYGEYSRLAFEGIGRDLSLKKSGVAVQFSWELLQNARNLGLIRRAFAEFGRRAAVKEDHEATRMLNTDNFNAANGNLATGDAAGTLSLEVLEAAFAQIGTQTWNGRRVSAPTSYALVVGPELALQAQKLKQITEIEVIETTGNTETRYKTGNPVGNRFTVVENPYLQEFGLNPGAWFLIGKNTLNPTVLNTFLEGYGSPQIFVKRTTTASPEEGSFENDDYETKVRHVVTGNFLLPQGTLGHFG